MLLKTGFLVVCGLAVSTSLFAGDMHPVDLTKYVNEKLDGGYGRLGQGNNLAKLPRGEQKFNDTTFEIGDGLMQLGSQKVEKHPERIDGIAVNRKCAKLHVLHATLYGGAAKNTTQTDIVVTQDEQIGEYSINYTDGTTEGIGIVHGRDVRDWWYVPGDSDEPTVGKVAWEGTNDFADGVRAGIRVYSSVWKNPYPDKEIKSIDFIGRKADTVAAPFCIAITLEDPDSTSTDSTSSKSPAK